LPNSSKVIKFLIIWQGFFGIVRARGGGNDALTATNFLRISRMLSVYDPVRNALKIDGNIEDEERMHLLTSYKDCMIIKLRENFKDAKIFRNNLKNFLLKGIISSSSNH
jgi:hypothetical protein